MTFNGIEQRASSARPQLHYTHCESLKKTISNSRVEACVAIQKIKSLGVLQFKFYVVKGGATNRDMSLTETC